MVGPVQPSTVSGTARHLLRFVHARGQPARIVAVDRLRMDSGGAMEPLVGRVEEQRQIAALLAAVRDGRTRVLFITGPAGIGKSRLAGTIASELPTYTHLLLE